MSDAAVFVLGVGRSGSSLTARILNLLGLDIGPEAGLQFDYPEHNARGYWEQLRTLAVNEGVLAALGGTFHYPPQLEPGWERSPALEPLRREAEALLAEFFPAGRPWVMKDARFSLTLPFWRQLVPDARTVICLRHPAEVGDSFRRFAANTALPLADWSALWHRYIASAIEVSQGQPRAFVFYDGYRDDLSGEVDRLAALAGVPVDADVLAAIRSFYDSGLDHHQASSAATRDGATELYDALWRLRVEEAL